MNDTRDETFEPPLQLLATAEIAANRYLATDDHTLARCRELAGRSLALRVTDWSLAVCVIAVNHGIQIRRWNDDTSFDVALTGSANAFAQVARRADVGAIGASGLNIEGDIGLASSFAGLAASIDFEAADWVDARFGPLAASVFGKGWHAARGLASRLNRELPAQLRDYLLEETEAVASRAALDEFSAEVARTRDAVDRLAARSAKTSPARGAKHSPAR